MSQCLQDIQCSAADIFQRITPIECMDNQLVVDSDIQVHTSLTLGGATITTESGVVDLPEKTMINGVPLVPDAFTGETIALPLETTLRGFQPTNEQFFYYFSNSTFAYGRGYIINGLSFGTMNEPSDPRGFPFIAPEDCVLTSVRFLYVVKGTPGFGNASNASAWLDVLDTNYNPYYTGVSFVIPSPAANSRNLVETQFEYFVRKGDSVGFYVSGEAPPTFSTTPFAVLGYRLLPPNTLPGQARPPLYVSSPRDRFPYQNIMRSHMAPIHFHDQMRVLREGLGGLYGRPLVEQEYAYRRSLQQDFLTRTQSSLYPASIVALLTQEKQGGWCLDVGPQPTRTLKTDYGWGGLWIDTHKTAMDPLEEGCVPAEHVRTDVVSCLRHYSAPPHIDFLNLELGGDTDTMQGLSNLFSSHTFGIIRCRHDRDDGMVYTSRNLILSQPSPYILLFRDVSGREDWFANPLLLPIAQTILEHPDNADPLPWEGCIRVILSLLKK